MAEFLQGGLSQDELQIYTEAYQAAVAQGGARNSLFGGGMATKIAEKAVMDSRTQNELVDDAGSVSPNGPRSSESLIEQILRSLAR